MFFLGSLHFCSCPCGKNCFLYTQPECKALSMFQLLPVLSHPPSMLHREEPGLVFSNLQWTIIMLKSVFPQAEWAWFPQPLLRGKMLWPLTVMVALSWPCSSLSCSGAASSEHRICVVWQVLRRWWDLPWPCLCSPGAAARAHRAHVELAAHQDAQVPSCSAAGHSSLGAVAGDLSFPVSLLLSFWSFMRSLLKHSLACPGSCKGQFSTWVWPLVHPSLVKTMSF